jgi:PHD/YefM family antitoxin component YafN of YafNO toxin-antitoxin module
MAPPLVKGERTVAVILSAADYRALYELTLQAGTSMAETLRGLIRAAAKEEGK